MTATLRDAALQAEKDTASKARDARAAERDKHLTALIDGWDERATLSYARDAEPLPMPDRDAFTWTGYPGYNLAGYSRQGTVYGWEWETDSVRFLYDATYSGQGLCVLLTCPDCGETHADHPYGLDGLGKLLRLGRSTSHECRTVAVRNLAYAIRQASEKTGLDPHTVAAMAADTDDAYPRR